jgi:hypothetical protein
MDRKPANFLVKTELLPDGMKRNVETFLYGALTILQSGLDVKKMFLAKWGRLEYNATKAGTLPYIWPKLDRVGFMVFAGPGDTD